MEPHGNRYFDPVCPDMPVLHVADQEICAELTAKLTSQSIGTTAFSAQKIASMIVGSQHLRRLAVKYSDDINSILNGHGAAVMARAEQEFLSEMARASDDAGAMLAIRRWRGRSCLTAALSDLAGLCDTETQMAWLSRAADAALRASLAFLINLAVARGKIKPVDSSMQGCGWTIIALGKLGAEELNYSSDVDLLILHDLATAPLAKEQVQPFYVGLTRDLVRLLSTATADGIGWRVDLRLRPDPGATAVSIDIDAATGYYESLARTWERAAFIRARPVAGDIQLAERFLSQIQPFIWRRTLDYTVMDDMKTMLRRPPQSNGWLGYNLKIGKNGIRQIEFFTHVLQLVAGGREAGLRQHQTAPALRALAKFDWITPDQADSLITAYNQLRRTEHRIQMLADSQTHSLPRSQSELAHFANFMGHAQPADLCAALTSIQDSIAFHAEHKILHSPADHAANNKNILLDDYDSLVAWLSENGFTRPHDVADTLSGWMAGRIAATRSERARVLLNRLMPDILMHFATAPTPDDIFAALAQFIEGLPASVQIFSLLDYNPQLTRLLGDMLVLSPQICDRLRRYPALFDLLLYRAFFAPIEAPDGLKKIFHEKIDGLPVELALDQIKILVRELKFRAQVQTLSFATDTDQLEASLTAIAEAAIDSVLTLARADMVRRYGEIDAQISIVALGRLGVKQLTAGSDLDLLIIYHAAPNSVSTGQRTLAAANYVLRLAQTMVSWISTPTAEGTLYDVDLRLRPEGKAGAIATSIDRLATYFDHDAWIWEKQALTKARPIAGDAGLNDKIQRLINSIINHDHPKDHLITAISDMRQRLQKQQKPVSKWHLRQIAGGLTDIDLLIQAWRLQHGRLFSGSGQPAHAILQTLFNKDVIDKNLYEQMTDAAKCLNEIHHSLRLTLGPAAPTTDMLPHGLHHFMLQRLDFPDETQFQNHFDLSLSTVIHAIDAYLAMAEKPL
jgi:glutamate-ammonia-ligase adenylyltransferase